MKTTELSSESNPLSSATGSKERSLHLTKFQHILTNISPSDNLWEEYDDYCREEVTSGTWSTLDQKRLVSMDYLSNKVMKLDQMEHTYSHHSIHDVQKYLPSLQSNDYLFDYLVITGDRTNDRIRQIKYEDLRTLPGRGADGHFQWINIKDLRAVKQITELYRLDKYIEASFLDSRCHSTIIPFSGGGIFLSSCVVAMFGISSKLIKTYFYSCDKLIITFERELLADISEDFASQVNSNFNNGRPSPEESSIDEEKETVHKQKLMNLLYTGHIDRSIMGSVMMKYLSSPDAYNTILKSGMLSILYEIGLEILFTSEGFLEFCSRTIVFLKSQMPVKLGPFEKILFFRDVSTLLSAIRVVHNIADEIGSNLSDLFDKNSCQFDTFRQFYSSDSELLLLTLLIDANKSRVTILERQKNEMTYLQKVLKHNNTMATERESKNLNLVATFFLPLSFLAGVFGMNFYEHGDSSIRLLNSPHGPQIFAAMCIGVVILNALLFSQGGLINMADYTQNLFRKKKLRN